MELDLTNTRFDNEIRLLANGDEFDSSDIKSCLAQTIKTSKLFMQSITDILHITIVVPVYGEHNRAKSKEEHVNGESFVTRKIAQMKWLVDTNPNVTWDILFVDDGCENESGRIIQTILEDTKLTSNVDVLFYNNKKSKKGGAVLHGIKHSLSSDIIIYTDADMSAHLGQCGNLIRPLIESDSIMSIGNRLDPISISGNGVFTIPKEIDDVYRTREQVRKTRFPSIAAISDTQCGFKAFNVKKCIPAIHQMQSIDDIFDIELLVRVAKLGTISEIPLIWLWSRCESNFYNPTSDKQTQINEYLHTTQRIITLSNTIHI